MCIKLVTARIYKYTFVIAAGVVMAIGSNPVRLFVGFSLFVVAIATAFQ